MLACAREVSRSRLDLAAGEPGMLNSGSTMKRVGSSLLRESLGLGLGLDVGLDLGLGMGMGLGLGLGLGVGLDLCLGVGMGLSLGLWLGLCLGLALGLSLEEAFGAGAIAAECGWPLCSQLRR